MTWFIYMNVDADSTNYHILGPVFTSILSETERKESIKSWYQDNPGDNATFHRMLSTIPYIPIRELSHYGQMLVYHLTGRTFNINKMAYPTSLALKENKQQVLVAEGHKSHWQLQELLLNNISHGIETDDAPSQLQTLLHQNQNFHGTSLERMKLSCYLFATHCCEAAIKGGLLPDTAYTIEESYIRQIQNCCISTEIPDYMQQMYQQYMKQIHALSAKANSLLSADIINAKNYIDTHIEEPLGIEIIAAALNYSPYYFSSKFKKETHQTLQEYIQSQKVLRAQLLLSTTELTFQEIAEQLNVPSRSWFAKIFKKYSGCTPGQFRTNPPEDHLLPNP